MEQGASTPEMVLCPSCGCKMLATHTRIEPAEVSGLADELERLALRATPQLIDGTVTRKTLADLLRLGAANQKPRADNWDRVYFEDDAALLVALVENLPAILVALQAPASSPAREGPAAMTQSEQGASTQELLPVVQADLDLLARIHESGGNKAAAFTLRQVGAVGCVLEGQAQLIASFRIEHTPSDRNAVLEEAARLRRALQSIANSACCGDCQEAALVAAEALAGGPVNGATTLGVTTPEPTEPAGVAGLADRLERLAAKATPGPWENDSLKSEGEYGSGPDTTVGYDVATIIAPDGKVLFDALNSDAGEIHEETASDEYGDVYAWDAVSLHNATLIVALRNNLPAIIAALRTPPLLEVAKEALEEAAYGLKVAGMTESLAEKKVLAALQAIKGAEQ